MYLWPGGELPEKAPHLLILHRAPAVFNGTDVLDAVACTPAAYSNLLPSFESRMIVSRTTLTASLFMSEGIRPPFLPKYTR